MIYVLHEYIQSKTQYLLYSIIFFEFILKSTHCNPETNYDESVNLLLHTLLRSSFLFSEIIIFNRNNKLGS